MSSWALPKIKSQKLPQIKKKPNVSRDFYPNNLYKVIADFQQKHQRCKDLDLLLNENFSEPSELITAALQSHDFTGRDVFGSSRKETFDSPNSDEEEANRSWSHNER